MFKKLIALTMVFAFLNVHAAAPVNNLKSLASAYDKLNFALTVEWDQKDKAFHTAQMKEFKKVVMNLQKEGLSNKEILEFAKVKINNKKAAKELETLFDVVKINKLTQQEAREFILETVKNNSSQGSNWLGSASTSSFIALLVIIAIIVALSPSHGGGSNGGGYYEDCYEDYACWDVCYDYDYYSCYTECGWETVCY